jgi:hypothetical protein
VSYSAPQSFFIRYRFNAPLKSPARHLHHFSYEPRKCESVSGKKKKGKEQGKTEQEDKKRRKRRYLGQARSPVEKKTGKGMEKTLKKLKEMKVGIKEEIKEMRKENQEVKREIDRLREALKNREQK